MRHNEGIFQPSRKIRPEGIEPGSWMFDEFKNFCNLDILTHTIAFWFFCSPESVRWPTVGKYKVDVASLESLAVPELQVKEETDLFIIDEVGKMELFSSAFFPAVMRVIESNIPVLATIPIPRQGRDIPGVARLRNHPGAAVFTLDTGNRDTMRDTICSQLRSLLQKR